MIIYLNDGDDGLDSEAVLATVYGLGYIPAVANGHLDLAPALAIVPDAATTSPCLPAWRSFCTLRATWPFYGCSATMSRMRLGHVRSSSSTSSALPPLRWRTDFSILFRSALIGASWSARAWWRLSHASSARQALGPRLRPHSVPVPAYFGVIAWIAYQFGHDGHRYRWRSFRAHMQVASSPWLVC